MRWFSSGGRYHRGRDWAAKPGEQQVGAAAPGLETPPALEREAVVREMDRLLKDAPEQERVRIIGDYLDPQRLAQRVAQKRQKLGALAQRGDLGGRPLRILSVADAWGSGAGGRVTVANGLATGLAEAGHDVYVAIGDEPPAGIANPRLHFIGPGFRRKDLPEMDVVMGHGPASGPQARQVHDKQYPDALMVHKVTFLAEVGRVQGLPFRGAAGEAIERSLVSTSDVAFGTGPVIAENVRRLAGETGSGTAVHEMFPGVPFLEPQYPPLDGEPILLLNGRADAPNKGAREFAEVNRILREEQGLNFVPMIRGCRDQTREQVKQMLSDKAKREVIVLPFTNDRTEIEADFRKAHGLVMISAAEGFGYSALEAQGAGMPFRAPSGSGFGESVRRTMPPEFASKVLVEQAYTERIPVRRWAQSVGELLRDIPGERVLSLDGRRRLQERGCTWEQAGESLAAVFQEALAARR